MNRPEQEGGDGGEGGAGGGGHRTSATVEAWAMSIRWERFDEHQTFAFEQLR